MTQHDGWPIPPNGQRPPSPNRPDHQQPTQRSPDSRLDAANPYAAQQLPPADSPQQEYQYPNYDQQSGYGQPYAGLASMHVTQAAPAPSEASPTAPKRSKNSRGKLWAVLGAVFVIGGVLTAAAFVMKPSFLGFRTVLDHAALEKTIEQQSGGLLSDVSCPAGEKAKSGATFQCLAAEGRKVDVVVRDSKGNYAWIAGN